MAPFYFGYMLEIFYYFIKLLIICSGIYYGRYFDVEGSRINSSTIIYKVIYVLKQSLSLLHRFINSCRELICTIGLTTAAKVQCLLPQIFVHQNFLSLAIYQTCLCLISPGFKRLKELILRIRGFNIIP